MLIIDTLLIGGLRFVLDKIAAAVDTELNDESQLREQLLAAEMRLELGEISQQEFDELEEEIIARLREVKTRQRGGDAAGVASGKVKVTGIEASFEGEEY
jgi:hypothetical protein